MNKITYLTLEPLHIEEAVGNQGALSKPYVIWVKYFCI